MKRVLYIVLGLATLIVLPIAGEAIAPVAPKFDSEPAEVTVIDTAHEPITTPEPTPTAEPEPEPESELISLGTFTVTAYCPCEKCCGIWALNRPNGIVYTASGAEAIEGITVGADWDTIPAGTEIYIEGVGYRTVQDKPAQWIVERYEGRILDLFFKDHQAAWNFGKQELEVFIFP